MDDARRTQGRRQEAEVADGGVGEANAVFGSDERRMQVRAYNLWVSMLRNRPFPAIGELDPESIVDFGANSVLLDFTAGLENPAIQFIGRTLREECGVDGHIRRINEVPARSLLSRLTDHYLKIIARRAPVGFEAEFVGIRGHETLYRGVLMPFSSDGTGIDFIYGVINWKERLPAPDQQRLADEIAEALAAPEPRGDAGVWADGPGGVAVDGALVDPASLTNQLRLARDSAASATAAAARGRAAFHRALGRAHDLALTAGTGSEAQAALRALAEHPPRRRDASALVAELVFGREPHEARFADIAAVLRHAQRRGVPRGALPRLLEAVPGGVAGFAADGRAARRG